MGLNGDDAGGLTEQRVVAKETAAVEPGMEGMSRAADSDMARIGYLAAVKCPLWLLTAEMVHGAGLGKITFPKDRLLIWESTEQKKRLASPCGLKV